MERFRAEFEVLDERFGYDGGDDYVEVLHSGGPKRNNLFITGSGGDLYSIRVTFAGAR